MKLVVGLGNVGRKYDGTRHNVGFDVISELVRRQAMRPAKGRFQGETYEGEWGGERVVLLCPHTLMNLSGGSVQPARDFYKLTNDQVLVVCDDFNLPLGKLRFRSKGSAGGQKGLADVIRRLGGEEIPRLRIGIGPPPPHWDIADFVLSRFSGADAKEIAETIRRAADGVVEWVARGTDHCMNQYNA